MKRFNTPGKPCIVQPSGLPGAPQGLPIVDDSLLYDHLAELKARQAALKRITHAMALQVELDPQPVFEAALKEVSQALGGPMTCLHLHDAEGRALQLVAGHRLDPVWSRAWSRLSLAGSTPPRPWPRPAAAAWNSWASRPPRDWRGWFPPRSRGRS